MVAPTPPKVSHLGETERTVGRWWEFAAPIPLPVYVNWRGLV